MESASFVHPGKKRSIHRKYDRRPKNRGKKAREDAPFGDHLPYKRPSSSRNRTHSATHSRTNPHAQKRKHATPANPDTFCMPPGIGHLLCCCCAVSLPLYRSKVFCCGSTGLLTTKFTELQKCERKRLSSFRQPRLQELHNHLLMTAADLPIAKRGTLNVPTV